MLNFDKFQYHENSIPKESTQKEEFFKNLETQFIEEINQSDIANEFLKKYDPSDISSFVKNYASKKVEITRYYNYYNLIYNEKETSELNYLKKAGLMLDAIRQKKLFILQLRWRAGQIKLEGINISYDFQFWSRHIASCPFIPPIEKSEVQFMKEFLLSDASSDEIYHYCYGQWQDYEELTEKDESGLPQNMPEWYDFYDQKMGTGVLLLLPDIKGAKEEKYFQCARDNNKENNAPVAYALNPVDVRPKLSIWGDDLYKFAEHYESNKYYKELFNYYGYHEKKMHQRPDKIEINEAINILNNADRPVYIPGNIIWHEAILAAASRYTNQKITECIDSVYEEYLMLKNLGITQGESKEDIAKEYAKDSTARMLRQWILKGRVANGEPNDFDY